MFKFGVDTFIWSEASERPWVIPKAKELGFEVLDIYSKLDSFPPNWSKKRLKKPVSKWLPPPLGKETNPISSDPAIRKTELNS